MSGLRAKNAAVKKYMTLSRQIGFKPADVNLRRMNAAQIDAARADLQRYADSLPTTERAAARVMENVRSSNKKSDIIKMIKGFNPGFRSRRTDTYEILLRKYRENLPTRTFHEQYYPITLKKFLENPIDGASITIDSKTLIRNVDSLHTPNGFFLAMDSNGDIKTLSNLESFKEELQKHVNGFQVNERTVGHGSDVEFIYDVIRFDKTVKLIWNSTATLRRNLSGAYFKYHNLTEFDLTRYQIFKRGDGARENKDNCLIYALKMAGIPMTSLNELKLKMFHHQVKTRDLKAIAVELDITFKVYSIKPSGDYHFVWYNKGHREVSLGLVDEHYFINETTDITAFCIKNYETCKGKPSFPSCRNAKGKKAKMLTSFEVVKRIFNDHRDLMLEPITLANIADRQCVDGLSEYTTLRAPKYFCECVKKNPGKSIIEIIKDCECPPNKIVSEVRDYSLITNKQIFKGKFKKDDPNDSFDIWFVDTETSIGSSGYHEASCLCAIKYSLKYDTFQEYTFFGFDCVSQFLNQLKNHALIYAHNMAFDFRMFVDHMTHLQTPIEAGTKLKQIQGKFGYNHIVFKDSFSFLPVALSKLPAMLQLQSGDKEVFPYTLINRWTFDKKIKLSECRKHIKLGLRKAFKANAIKIGAFDGTSVDMKKYTIHYCMQDTRILAQAFTKFRKQILEVCKIDILPLVSLPQLSDEFLKSRHVYDDCFAISGISQDFIRKCCVGGRVMCNQNKKWHIKGDIVNGEKVSGVNSGGIADFDAVSLYPSAMSMLPGFVKGLPKVLSPKQIECFDSIRKTMDAYYVEIRVLSHGTNLEFPLQSIKDSAGIRNFTNDIDGQIFHVDNFALEDFIEFQNIKYEVIRGYYFNDGFNTEIKDTISFMFNERLKLKKEGNNLQNVYKLLMNASYGKLIQKPIKTKKTFVKSEDISNFVARNHKFIDSYNQINNDLYVVKTRKSIINHFTACHLASNILSMSKRIMNRVMCLAEAKGLKIYYQDTDSMHLHESAIPILSKAFSEKYNQELIGKHMGQFHTDFDVGDSSASNIRAVESIFLGKKCYIDKLKYNNKFLNDKYAYHIRVKGIPTQSIRDFDSDYMKTYKRLLNGEELTFDLAKYCPLQIDRDYRARAKSSGLTRSLHF